jgi:hypothetical protein
VVTVGGAEFDGDFEVSEGGIGFASQAIQGRKRIMDVIRLWRKLSGL